jgi:peptidase C39-like protein
MQALTFSRRGRLPLIRQAEAAECGLACMAMVASYYEDRSQHSQAAPPRFLKRCDSPRDRTDREPNALVLPALTVRAC